MPVDHETLDLAAAKVEEQVAGAGHREAEARTAAVRRAACLEVQLERVGDPPDAGGAGDRLGPREHVGAGGPVQAPLRQAARSTLASLGLGVMPGIRPRLAIGRPSISLMSPVKSIGLAPEM